jgi:hypothetical protein
MPEDLHGWYCAHCCPACKPQHMTQQTVDPILQDPVETQTDSAPQAA